MWRWAKDAARRLRGDDDARPEAETWHLDGGGDALCTWTVRVRRCGGRGAMASLWEGDTLVAAVRGATDVEALENLGAIRNPTVRIAGARLRVVRRQGVC